MNGIHEGVRRAMFMAPMVMARMAVVSVGCLGGLLTLPATAAGMGSAIVMALPQDGPVTVEATGRGESPKEARKEAIVAALRQIVGEYVEADVQLADDEVVKNEILSFSNAGGVKSEQVGEPRVVGDFVEITMRVTVEPKPLVARVKGAAKAGARLDGAALAAEIAAAKDDYEAKKRVLDKAFANLPDAFMTIRIVDSEGKDTTGIDRKLVTVDKKTGEATITIPVVLGFDSAVWKNNVYPALDEVLTAAAKRKIVDGLIVDRGSATSYGGGVSPEELSSVPYSGTRTIPQPIPRSGEWQTITSVALLRENLGRGRQLNFDLYEVDRDDLPLMIVNPNRYLDRLAMPPRVLRLRLVDSSGEVIDGNDVSMVTRGDPSTWNHSWFRGTSREFSQSLDLRPFADDWGVSRNTIVVAPLWLNRGLSSPEIAYPVSFTLPTQDLELIERVEVELIGPGGAN